VNFMIRVDDLGWTPDKEPDAGLDLAKRFHEAMAGLPYLGGIIPAMLDDDALAWLSSKPAGLTIALHGWDHSRVDGVDSEFRGKDLDECREMLYRGQKRMDGPHFHLIPPFNSVEPDLPEACYLEAIRYIWGGGRHDRKEPSMWATPPQPYPLGRVTFVPSWIPTYAATLWRMSEECPPLTEKLPRLLDRLGKAVITLHITWESARCDDLEGVRWLVDQIKDRVISPDEFLK
jgi:hypothetical protein